MQIPLEISIDLTAQELLKPLSPTGMVEVEDICDVDPLLRTGAFAANSEHTVAAELPFASSDCDDSIEIELSAEEIDELLSLAVKS